MIWIAEVHSAITTLDTDSECSIPPGKQSSDEGTEIGEDVDDEEEQEDT
jgi:hypothetical protein